MNKSESINELATALAKAQGQMEGAKKDSSNPFFKSKYADLAAVVEAVKKPFSDNGLSYIQITDLPEGDGDAVLIETVLMHSSGQWVSGKLRMPVSKHDAQGVGSAITYGRRYGLQAMAGVPAEDDDGNAAAASAPKTPTVKVPTAVQNQVHEDTIRYLEQGDENGLRETWAGFGADEKVVLWSLFTPQQRSSIKKIMGQMPPSQPVGPT